MGGRLAVVISCSPTPEDRALRDELERHLAGLMQEGVISLWHDGLITPGQRVDNEVKRHLDSADVVLLLISPAFMHSLDSNEVKRAMERHESGKARVVPIILRPVAWGTAPFGPLLPLPKNGKAVSNWKHRGQAFLEIAAGVREVVEELTHPAEGDTGITPGRPTPNTPTSPLHEARRKAESRVVEELGNAPQPGVFLQLKLDGRKEDLIRFCQTWLAEDDSHPAINILIGPLGSGKTIATCLVQRALQTGGGPHLDLWVPFRDTNFFTDDPDASLGKLFNLGGSVRLWDKQLGLRCLILDGLDEGLAWNRVKVQRWLDILLRRAMTAATRPRILICGRDVTLDRHLIPPGLLDRIRSFNASRSPTHKEPEFLRLGAWNDADLRSALTDLLVQRHGERLRAGYVHRRIQELIAPGVLTSPLLYRLTFEILVRAFNEGRPLPELQSEWDVLSQWISQIIGADGVNYSCTLNDDQRRRVAGTIALILVCTNSGIAGLPARELRGHGLFKQLLARAPELRRIGKGALDELTRGTLLKSHDGRFAPFHEAILYHLAAEALAELTGDQGGGLPPPAAPPGGGPGPGGGPSPGGGPPRPASSSGGPGGRPHRPRAGGKRLAVVRTEVLFDIVQHVVEHGFTDRETLVRALQPDSALKQTFTYLAKYQQTDRPGLPSVGLEGVQLESVEPSRRVTGAAQPLEPLFAAARVMLRDALLLQASKEEGDPIREQELARLSALPDFEFEKTTIPAGTYPVWRLDDQRLRRLESVEISHSVYLARELCTVAEYAEFLRANPAERLPEQPEAAWKRSGAQVQFRRDAARSPVAGVSREEARRYCEWLERSRYGGALEVRLPEPEWLQVAAWGPELRELPWQDVGPFGHEELLCRVWQWTEETRGAEALVFGGSAGLGTDLESAKATLLRGWPDLCRPVADSTRDPRIGFRISLTVAT